MDILIKPIISEYSLNLASKGLYTFVVNLKANKYQIKEAIEKMFKVDVVAVKTAIVKGKRRKTRTKKGVTGEKILRYKKAIVKLKPEQKIDIFEVGSTQGENKS